MTSLSYWSGHDDNYLIYICIILNCCLFFRKEWTNKNDVELPFILQPSLYQKYLFGDVQKKSKELIQEPPNNLSGSVNVSKICAIFFKQFYILVQCQALGTS